jgi:multiple sugar transport system substrate-binding protein
MRKLYSLFAVVLVLAFMAAACAQPTPETIVETVVVTEEVEVVKTEVVEKEVVVTEVVVETQEVEVEVEVPVPATTIVMSSEMFAPPAEQQFFINEILKPFEEETGITVNFQVIEGQDMFDRVTVQQETGHITTDVILVFNGRFPWWTDAGYVVSLDDATSGWTDRTILQAFDATATADGTRYFVPISADVYLTIANNKALDYLPEGADIDSLTYEQYADWAAAIAEGEGEGKVCITGIPQQMWIYQFGTSALSYGLNPAGAGEPAFPNINSEGAAKAWEQWAKIGAADGFMPTVLTVNNCTDFLMREEGWLAVTHNARVGQVYASNETQYTVGPAPSGDAGIGTIAGAHGVGVVEGSANAEAAFLLMEYLTRPEVQVKMNKGTGGFIPVVAEAIDYLGDDPTDEIITKALLVLETGTPSYLPVADFQDWGAVKKVFDDVFTAMVLGGDGTVDQALLDSAQAEIDAIRK